MHYFGGKSRVGKKIAEYINIYSSDYTSYYEPFCGGCWVLKDINFKYRFASDNNKYVIAMFNALKDGWIPPDVVTEEDYKKAKNRELSDELIGFIGIGCSFSGKWFGGFARNKAGRNYALTAKNSLLSKMEYLKDVVFLSIDYKIWTPQNTITYCDPPYRGYTNGYITKGFDSNEFWNVMRDWSKSNKVIISEYHAPLDFKCVKEFKTRINMKGKQKVRVEKLFEWEGND